MFFEPPAGEAPAASTPAADVTARDGLLLWRGTPVMPVAEIRLRGAHNLENAMVAAGLALARGLDPDAVRAALRELRRRRAPARGGGDAGPACSTWTTPRRRTSPRPSSACAPFPAASTPSSAAAARARTTRRSPPPRAERCRAAYLIGEEAEALGAALAGAGVPAHDCGTLDRAVAAARAAAAAGDVVLLSPACASYDQYRSFEERGRHFRALVEGGEA